MNFKEMMGQFKNREFAVSQDLEGDSIPQLSKQMQ